MQFTGCLITNYKLLNLNILAPIVSIRLPKTAMNSTFRGILRSTELVWHSFDHHRKHLTKRKYPFFWNRFFFWNFFWNLKNNISLNFSLKMQLPHLNRPF